MKTLYALSLSVAAILVLGASGQASAAEFYGLGSAGCCGGGGYGGCGCGGHGYAGCGSGGCGVGYGYGTFWYVGDYAPYVLGHGPMYISGDRPTGVYWFVRPDSSDTTLVSPKHQ